MKYIISFLSLSLVLFTTACNNSSDDEETLVAPETKGVQATNSNETFQPAQTTSSDAAITTTSMPQVNPVPSTGALNPEHGKPGHRCDIAVGAPLDGKPATSAAVTPASSTVTSPVISSKSTTAPAVSGSNLNPEHGKPGHRCDIAVGAPLDGAPAKPAVTTTQPTVTSVPANQQKAPLITPVLPTSSTTTAPGMNPEHGKPGHRCDIAVGAPLSSAPKQ